VATFPGSPTTCPVQRTNERAEIGHALQGNGGRQQRVMLGLARVGVRAWPTGAKALRALQAGAAGEAGTRAALRLHAGAEGLRSAE